MWLSTTKYFSPSFSYTVPPRRADNGCWCRDRLGRYRSEVEVDVLGSILRVGEHDGPVIQVDHPADGIDPDHGRQRGYRHVGLGTHDLRDDHADLIVHQREPAPVRGRIVRFEWAFRQFERGHC